MGDTPPLDTMARGLLMLSPRLRPMLDSTMEDMDTVLDMLVSAMPDLDMLDMDMAILATDTPPLDTMARGLLMLSLRLRLMLDSTMEDMDMVWICWSWLCRTWICWIRIWLSCLRILHPWILWQEAADAEPEAKADAGLYYGGYGYGLGYAGLGYAGLGYAGLGYAAPAYGYSTLGYYGKRSADAEPEAKADAGLYYGGYGLGYAGLGYAGLGYAGLGYAGLG